MAAACVCGGCLVLTVQAALLLTVRLDITVAALLSCRRFVALVLSVKRASEARPMDWSQ